MSYARKVDRVQAELVQAIERLGFYAHDCSRVGGGFPDLLLAKGGRLTLAEVKDPHRPVRLTPAQVLFHEAMRAHGVTVEVLTDLDSLRVLHRELRERKEYSV